MNRLGVAILSLALLSAGFVGEPGGCGAVSLDSFGTDMVAGLTVADPADAADAAGDSFSWECDFEQNSVLGQTEKSDWYSSGPDNSLDRSPGLFSVQKVDGSNVFGTLDSGRNIHSHLVTNESANWTNYEFGGVMMRDNAGGGVGVTFLSDYPNADHYYRLRAYWSNAFEFDPHGTTLSGTTVSDVQAEPGVWYRFLVRVEDDGAATHVQAKVWREGAGEPDAWQLDAYDSSGTRRVSGTIGVWAMDAGGKWVDNLWVRGLPVDAPAGVVADAGQDQSLTDGDGDGVETVTLDGSGSTGDIDTYRWILDGQILAEGDSPLADVDLPVGANTVTLEVVGADQTDTDSVVIDIEPDAPQDCETSASNWRNFAAAASGGLCTVNFVAVPNGENIDGIFAMSDGAGSAYSDFAVLVRFNTSGAIDARDGSHYSADTALAYNAGEAYRFRLVINCAGKTYDVYVTPEDGVERRIAQGYAFRSEQSDVSVLNNWAIQAGAGSHDVCDLTMESGTGGDPMPPVANAGPDQSILDLNDDGVESVQLDASASYDPDGEIVDYRWTEGSTVLASGPTATATVSLPVGSHTIDLLVTDDSGDQDSDSAVIVVNELGDGDVTMQSTVSRHGITWTFDHDYPVGVFANGDFFVVGPATIAAISPAPGGGRNGSMVNPTGEDVQAYDSRAYEYNASYGVTPPFTLGANESLVSTKSADGGYTNLDTAAVLTCLATAPPAGTFRPPYCGDSKPLHNVSQLRMQLLPALAPVAGTPSVSEVAGKIERVWLDHQPYWHGKYIHPQQNMPGYGREIATEINDAALLTLLNVPNKDLVVIRLVQLGIDFCGIADAGGEWSADGGHASGRKFPILYAGHLLNDAHMLNIGVSGTSFGEDCQTFYVSQADVDRGVGYTQSDIGMPEWGIRHCYWPEQDNPAWSAPYRECCTANAWVGAILSAHILGLTDEWNHPVLFDYQDRYMATESPGSFRSWSSFAGTMWDTYR